MKRLVLFLSITTILLLTFLPNKDTDFGWHYQCGKLLISHQNNCTTNRFSYFLSDYQANNPSFIYDATIALVYDRFGFVGLSLINAVFFALIFFCLTKMFSSLPTEIIMGGFIAIFFLSYGVLGLGLRSQLFSYLFFIIFLLIIHHLNRIPSLIWLFPLIMVIWVNTHIGFVIGLVLLGSYCCEAVYLRRSILPTILTTLLTIGAVFLNPFRLGVFRALLNHFTSPLNMMVAEWVAPSSVQILFVICLTGLIGYFLVKEVHSPYRFIALVIFATITIRAQRNLPLFYTFAFYCLLTIPPIKRTIINFFRLNRLQPIFLVFLFIINSLIFIIQVPSTYLFDTHEMEYCTKGLRPLPCQAVKQFPNLSGNVFTMYEWGGYLIWKKPTSRVFVDGRMPAWKDENDQSPYQVFLEIIQTKPGWNEKLRRWKTDYLLIETGSFLDLLLHRQTEQYGWKEKYRDPIAVVYQNLNP